MRISVLKSSCDKLAGKSATPALARTRLMASNASVEGPFASFFASAYMSSTSAKRMRGKLTGEFLRIGASSPGVTNFLIGIKASSGKVVLIAGGDICSVPVGQYNL